MFLCVALLTAHCCRSVTKSCPNLCDPVDCSMPGLPVLHYIFQTYVHWVGDAIQLFHPLSSSSPPALNPSQHQGLFQWISSFTSGGQSIGASTSASIFPMSQLFTGGQSIGVSALVQSFKWTPRTDLLQNGLVGSPCSPRDSQESSPTPQFKSINSSALSSLCDPTLISIHDYWKNRIFD